MPSIYKSIYLEREPLTATSLSEIKSISDRQAFSAYMFKLIKQKQNQEEILYKKKIGNQNIYLIGLYNNLFLFIEEDIEDASNYFMREAVSVHTVGDVEEVTDKYLEEYKELFIRKKSIDDINWYQKNKTEVDYLFQEIREKRKLIMKNNNKG